MKKNKKIYTSYNIGLDIGTNSVGWAVTDDIGNILKLNSKRHLWGVRLFDDANTAEERRIFRSNARRMSRRKERIRLLQELLKEEIDPNFFEILKLGNYQIGDFIFDKKNNKKNIRNNKYNLFNEDNFNDKVFFTKYKTIYHLREELLKTDNKIDIRLVYLALHHIIKYRGNFLYSGSFKIDNIDEIKSKLEQVLKDIFIDQVSLEDKLLEDIFKLLKNNSMYKRQKQEELVNLFKINDAETIKKLKALFGLIICKKEKISSIFNIENSSNDGNNIDSISLIDDYDEDSISNMLGDQYETFNLLKELNSWYVLQDILKGSNYISEAFIKKYNKYNVDLKLLKKIYKEYIPEKYEVMFKNVEEKQITYYNFDHKKLKWEDFVKKIKSDINTLGNFKEKEKILKDIENEDFLIKLNTRYNGAIPYQLHEIELLKIIDNQGKYYKSLLENKEKIQKILSFRIPYYVGPLHNDINQPNNWSIRKPSMENEKVYPWNFENIIDKDASANEFIKRMTNKCTYLTDEDVIPKNSLLYSEYCVLNELNNIRYNNGKKLSIEEKNKIIEELFKKTKTISKEKLKKFLEVENQIKISNITGFQKENEFASKLESYIDFSSEKILNRKLKNEDYSMIEEIIEWITIFEDKDILYRKLEKYREILNEKQINYIVKKLKYTGWSRLSRKLLLDLKYQDEYGNKHNIMDLLRNTDYNFMQIINDKTLGFDKNIKDNQKIIEYKKLNNKFYLDNIAPLATSPKNKRGIWQTLKIVDEIKNVIGFGPTNIFIEFAREDQESIRTSSRLKKLEKSYEKFYSLYKEEIDKELIKNLKSTKKDISDRLYLYYMQNGKCMYSGGKLDINDLNKYQIDHIIPQSKIKDNSFDNKVLVFSKYNQRKLDGFLDNNIINKQKLFWQKLVDCGLMSQVKYFNLVNNEETDKKIEGFIKRQLVETRQITKSVTNILQNLFEKAQVYSLKANLGHDFREKYDILKIREINDFHHAQDAYINSIIGIYINQKYPKMLKEFVYKDYIKYYKKETQEDNKNKNNYGFIVSNIGKGYKVIKENGKVINFTDENEEKRLENILNQLEIEDYFITKKLEEKTGAFYKQNACSKREVEKMGNPIRIKENMDPLKYGAYTGEVPAYSTLIEYSLKGKREFLIINIPVKESLYIKDDYNRLIEYIERKFNLDNIKILKRKILSNQLIYKEGKPYHIVSSGEIKIKKQMRLSKNDQFIIYIAINDIKNVKSNIYLKTYNILKKKLKNEFNEYLNEIEKHLEKREKILEKYSDSDETRKEYYINKIDIATYTKQLALIKSYDIISEKIKNEYFENIGFNLDTYRKNYLKLNEEEKISIIKLLTTLTSGKSIDLKKIGGKSDQGRIKVSNMNSNWLKDVCFVEQSVTGIYEKRFRIDELENSNNIK